MKFFIVFFLSFISCFTQEAGLNKYFEKGNQLFLNKNYSGALKQYQLIENKGFSSAELFYNMGNCFYLSKNNTQAIFNYEKALMINPNLHKTIINLEKANAKTIDLLYQQKITTSSDFFFYYFKYLPLKLWFFLGLISAFAFVYFYVKKQNKILIATICLFTIALGACLSHQLNNQRKYAIVFINKTAVFSNKLNKKTFTFLNEGSKIEVLNTQNERYKISLPNLSEGYINKENVKIIEN